MTQLYVAVRVRIFFIMIMFGLALSAPKAQAKAQDHVEPSFLAFGDLRGYLEPCGCDPLTDLGGVRRIEAYIRRERALNRGTYVLNLGNNLAPYHIVESTRSLKNPFLIEALTQMQPDAVLVNALELHWLLGASTPKLPWVLSNLAKPAKAQLPAVNQWLVLTAKVSTSTTPDKKAQNIYIFGYLSPEMHKGLPETEQSNFKKLLRPFSHDLLRDWRKSTREGKRILLFSGTDTDLSILQKSGFFDVIVSANKADLNAEPGVEEKGNPSLLVRGQNRNHPIYMVPLGGQGILRSGHARRFEAKPLKELVQEKAKPTDSSPLLPAFHKKELGPDFVTWLAPDQGGEGLMTEIFDRYRQATGQEFSVRAKQRVADLTASPFVGAAACQGCHPAAYNTWKQSKHAIAYDTLMKKNVHRDRECISCHVLAGEEFGGFADFEHSPQFAGVQCENCHGPRREHVQNPIAKSAIATGADHKKYLPKEVCTNCHKVPHSSQFKFEDYWPRIQHGK